MTLFKNCQSIKKRRVKENSQEWFEGEIADENKNREKLFTGLKNLKLHNDKDIYKVAR